MRLMSGVSRQARGGVLVAGDERPAELRLPKTPPTLRRLHLRSFPGTLRSPDYTRSCSRFGDESGDNEIGLAVLPRRSPGRSYCRPSFHGRMEFFGAISGDDVKGTSGR